MTHPYDYVSDRERFVECEDCKRDRNCKKVQVGSYGIDLCGVCRQTLEDGLRAEREGWKEDSRARAV